MFKLNQAVKVLNNKDYPFAGKITFCGHDNEYEITFSNGRIAFFNANQLISAITN